MIFKDKVKLLRYAVETVFVVLGILVFRVMKPQSASDCASKIARFVGKKISVTKLAYKNLSNAIPDLNEAQKLEVIDNMWDNLGRIIGEFPHVCAQNIEEIGAIVEMSQQTKDNIGYIKGQGKGGIIFSGHIGNWEVGPKLFLSQGIEVSTVYRPLNNPYVEKITAKMRGVDLIEKSVSGSRKIVEVIKKGGFVIILADQKITEGEPVKFFHDDAITTTSIARIALRYDILLVPARSIRLDKKFKFIVEVEKPLAIQRSGDVNFDLINVTRTINQKLEDWIRQYPAQWFWVHNRWKR